MKSQYKANSKKTSEKSSNWGEFGYIEPIKRWATELRKATSKPIDPQQWEIIGRAAMILQEDGDVDSTLLSKIASEAGMNFSTIDSDEFINMVNFDSYPTKKCPTLIYTPQGEWSEDCKSDGKPRGDILRFRNKLSSYLANIDPKYPIVFATLGETYSELAPSLRQVGAFDRRFMIPKFTLETKGEQFIKSIGRDICNSSLTSYPGKVGKVLEMNFDEARRQSLIALGMKRLHAKESRKLEFNDLVYFSIHGSAEVERTKESNKSLLKRVAIHEAGHALVAAIDSNGSNIPEYLTVMPFGDNAGLACDSYAYYYGIDGQQTFKDLRHKIRVQLAGRAAEEILYGPENISAWGPRSDLLSATRGAKKLIAICGFSSNMQSREANTENLAVIDDEASPAEDSYAVEKVRKFLGQEYKVVRSILEVNKFKLLEIQKALLKDMILNQLELKKIIGDTANCHHPIIGKARRMAM